VIRKGRFIFTSLPPVDTVPTWHIATQDALSWLKGLGGSKVRCWVTSPPYYSQVNYGHPDQYGQEATVEEYIANQAYISKWMLANSTPDANLFWVIRDSSNGSGGAGGDYRNGDGTYRFTQRGARIAEYPKKSQLLIPERTRIAFQEVGWCPILSIIWDKQDSRRGALDRPSYSYEQVLVFSASPQHFWNREAVLQEYSPESLAQLKKKYEGKGGIDYAATGQEDPSDTKRRMCAAMQKREGALLRSVWQISSGSQPVITVDGVDVRAVAAMPMLLAEICINLGSEPGDIVSDPYVGFGTTIAAAVKWGRNAIGCEINPLFAKAAAQRVEDMRIGTLFLD
jgi:DNA modification methylase